MSILAGDHGEMLVGATAGSIALDVLQTIGPGHLAGKILIDTTNPLDFSRGMPPSLFVGNTDSLGEQIQRAFPQLKVVKALNTVVVDLMVNPGQVAEGDHHLFVCGNDAQAKARVIVLLTHRFGWREIIDLGDITGTRGTEMLLPISFRLWQVLRTRMVNSKVVRA